VKKDEYNRLKPTKVEPTECRQVKKLSAIVFLLKTDDYFTDSKRLKPKALKSSLEKTESELDQTL
jgi:hypothetical protein